MAREADADPDVVVVGAGHNGLICAAYLARAGVRTTVVEARTFTGGCSASENFQGARVNLCNCDHVVVRSLPLIEDLGLAAHGLRYLDLRPAQVAMSWSDDRPAVLFADPEETLASLAVTQPDQVAGYRRYLADALPVARLVLDLAQRPPTASTAARALSARRGRGLARLLQWSRRPVSAVLREYFTSETLLGAAVATGPAVWGVSPHLPGTGLGALRFALLHVIGPGRPVGGSGALTDAVLAAFEQAGGTLLADSPVGSLLVERQRVVGVRLRDGREIRARRVVVACDPRRALLEWLNPSPPSADRLLARWRGQPVLDGYESKIDAIVDAAPQLAAFDDTLMGRLGVSAAELAASTTVVSPTVDAIAAAHRRSEAGGVVADEPILMMNVPSLIDATVKAPGGGHVFSLEALFTPFALLGGWPASAEPARWLSVASRHYRTPLTDGMRHWRAMTPDVYDRDLGMPRGFAPSFAGGPLAALLGTTPELTRYRTPIEGLFLTGAGTFPGAGVWGAPGRNTARVLLHDLNRAGTAGEGVT